MWYSKLYILAGWTEHHENTQNDPPGKPQAAKIHTGTATIPCVKIPEFKSY